MGPFLGLALAITVTQADVSVADCAKGATPIVVAVQRAYPGANVVSADYAVLVNDVAYYITDRAYENLYNYCHNVGSFEPQAFFAVPE